MLIRKRQYNFEIKVKFIVEPQFINGAQNDRMSKVKKKLAKCDVNFVTYASVSRAGVGILHGEKIWTNSADFQRFSSITTTLP